MERVVDTIFGKRLGNSFYHINTEYNSRLSVDTSEDTLIPFMIAEIAKIMSGSNLTDEVGMILGKIKDALNAKDYNKVNQLFASLSFLKYELWFVIRTDLDESSEISNISRIYAMNKDLADLDLPKINNLQSGVTNVFDTDLDINMNAMVMSFIDSGKIRIEEADLIGLTPILEDYKTLSSTKETALMDTSNVLHMLEQLKFHFIISLNQGPSIEEI